MGRRNRILPRPSLFRRIERRVVSGAMGMVVFFIERLVLRAARKSQSP